MKFVFLSFSLSLSSLRIEPMTEEKTLYGNRTRYVKIDWIAQLIQQIFSVFIVYKYHTIITIIATFICDIKYNWDLNNGMNDIDFLARFVAAAAAVVSSIHDAEKKELRLHNFIDVQILGILLYDSNVYFHIYAQLWYAQNTHTFTYSLKIKRK